jgi:hypothetical protein
MRVILNLTVFILTITGCVQKTNEKQKHLDAGKVEIFKEHYLVSIDGNSVQAYTKGQLKHLLRNCNSNDKLLIMVRDATSGQIKTAIETLHELNLVKHKVEITTDYFKLPY